ncbi:DUF4157 domain-containing protein [Dokdonia sp.]|uniref:eCIS core domain-containing protein n=1 Tax=Dokdonia sp. TaxID=2024995 RepID=UPI003267CB9C
MNTHADNVQKNKNESAASAVSQRKSSSKPTFHFEDNRPEAVAQRKILEMVDNYTSQQQHPIQKKKNDTGLPDNLKTGIENLSGISMDDVKVHRNSDKPAQLQAHAYAQGSDIHLGPGQDKHLPHEAWHVVQQKQGRVKPTMQMKGKVNVNDDDDLEKEADLMGARAMALQLSTKEQTNDLATPTSKALTGQSNVFQMRWINIDGTNQSYWEGRRGPTQSDLDALARNRRIRVDPPALQSMPNAPNANRPHGLFLAASDTSRGEIGAPFPLPPPRADQVMPQSTHHEDVSWFHDGHRVQHQEPRRSERTIHGGVSARDQLQQFGLPDYPRAPWAHTQPDHATPVGQDREDTAMRHPSTEQANQQHTVREYAQSSVARRMGGVIASRHLQGEQPGRPGLFSTMDFGTTFLTGQDIRTHTDSVPYFTQQPGRYGDEDAHAHTLDTFGANALGSSLRDSGFLDEDDLPDQFHSPPDTDTTGMVWEEYGSSTNPSSAIEMADADEEADGDGGPPVIVPAPANTLTLAQMDAHYHAGNVWAGNQGTFSAEFAIFQANPAFAFTTLVQGGLLTANALALATALGNAFTALTNHYQQQGLAVPNYIPPDIQDIVFDHIDPVHGRSLWALLRYLTAANLGGGGD